MRTTYTEKRFFKWYEDEVSVSLRNKSGSYGWGSEVFVVADKNGAGIHCGERGKDGRNDLTGVDGESRNRGGQLPIVILEDDNRIQAGADDKDQ